jgi:predicted flap endonuclease-1-like 5' DNA nuclease
VPVETPVAPSPTPDDLVIIEGIGPKISSVLQANGIDTFAQLASTQIGDLQQILLKEGLRLADPTSWPEQARLAAAGDWDGLNALQAQLKGGRQV